MWNKNIAKKYQFTVYSPRLIFFVVVSQIADQIQKRYLKS
jgi:hypothetical protein